MRTTIVMGLGLALSLAGVAAAQQPGSEAPRRDRNEDPRGPGDRFERCGGAPAGFLLRGITLSDAQKTQLKALRKSQHDKMAANRDQMHKQMNEARAARERGDTAAVRAIMQRHREAMATAREQEVAAIRNILTAEQRIQFDKSVAELKQRQQERGERFGPRGDHGPRGRRFSRGG